MHIASAFERRLLVKAGEIEKDSLAGIYLGIRILFYYLKEDRSRCAPSKGSDEIERLMQSIFLRHAAIKFAKTHRKPN